MLMNRITSLNRARKYFQPILCQTPIKYFSNSNSSSNNNNKSDWQTIYQNGGNSIGTYGLIGCSFLSTILTDSFAIPFCLGTAGFTMWMSSSLAVNEIKYNKLNDNIIIQQSRRMLIFKQNERQINLNQLNVQYLGSHFAFVNINVDDIFKTYIISLSEEDKLLTQLLQKRKNSS